MKNPLDTQKTYLQFDPDNVRGSLEQLQDQITDVWEQGEKLKVKPYVDIDHIIIAGMGGSSLGAHVIATTLSDQLTTPLTIIRDYTLPNWVNKNTLVVLSSYSGNTEEIIRIYDHAREKRVKLAVFTSGGKLEKLAKKNKLPLFSIQPHHNPSKQPRMALGYAIVGMLHFLQQLGVTDISEKIAETAQQGIQQLHETCTPDISSEKNPAKELAFHIIEQSPMIITGNHLEGAAHVFCNQLNETAKNMSDFRVIPELNHHLLEGLTHPKQLSSYMLPIFITSHLYNPRILKRFSITQSITEKQHFKVLDIPMQTKTKFSQAFELITLGSWTSFYLAMLHKVNPAEIPWVDEFKKRLAKT